MKTDQLLKSDVMSELAWDTSVGECAGKDRVVTLSGQVDFLQEREAAVDAAWCAKGATRVVNRIGVSA